MVLHVYHEHKTMEIKFDEEVILNRLKQDDGRALELIYRHYWEQLFNHAYNRLQDEDETKELIQDLFVDLWQKRKEVAIRTSLTAYLHAALRFKILNHIKAAIVRERYRSSIDHNKFNPRSDVEDTFNYAELHSALHTALQLLPPQPRRVYELRHNEGLSYAEIADSLRISVSTVEKHMIKALRYIRKHLRQYNG